jgi:hypothetical protein
MMEVAVRVYCECRGASRVIQFTYSETSKSPRTVVGTPLSSRPLPYTSLMKIFFLLCAAVAVAQEHLGAIVIEVFTSRMDCMGESEFVTTWERLCTPFPSNNPLRRTWTASQTTCINPSNVQQIGPLSAAVQVYGNAEPKCTGTPIIATLSTPSPPTDPLTSCGQANIASNPSLSFSYRFRNITCASYLVPVPTQGGIQYTRPFQLATYANPGCSGDVRRDILNVNQALNRPIPCSWGGFRGNRGANFTLSGAGPNNVVSTGSLTVFLPTASGVAPGRGCTSPSSAPPPSLISIPIRINGAPNTNISLQTGICEAIPIPLAPDGSTFETSYLRVEELADFVNRQAGELPPGLTSVQIGLIVGAVMLFLAINVYLANRWGYCVFKAAPMKAPMPPPGGARAKAPTMPGLPPPTSTGVGGVGGVGGGAGQKAPGQPPQLLLQPPPPGGAGSRGGPVPNPLNVINNSTPGVSEWANKRA